MQSVLPDAFTIITADLFDAGFIAVRFAPEAALY
jgi:hypothetical protein